MSSSALTPQSIRHEERRFTFNGFTYCAQLWGEPSQHVAIALHGWLDNSASFDIIAPQLEGVQVLAIDLAGHGFSDHRDGFTDYSLWSEIAAIYAIADKMGWQQFALLGHSRGAMMSLLTAGVYPDRISHLVMIDAFLPPVVEPHSAVERLVNSVEEIQRRLDRKLSLYRLYEEAITARCLSPFAHVTQATATLLATRGLREVDGKFHWHADGKLWALSNVALSIQQLEAFLEKITAPSLLILGSQGIIGKIKTDADVYRVSQQWLSRLNTDVQVFDDGHFLHMEQSSTEVADSVQYFITSK